VSEIVKDRAVVLRTYEYGETSLVVSVLTRELGKIRLLAKGANRTGSPFAGALRTGSIGEIVFYYKQDRGLHPLKEIESRNVFENYVEDLEKLCIFQAGLEVVDRAVIEREADERTFDLLEGFITALPGADDAWAVLFTFYVRLLKMSGVYPSINGCTVCGKELAGGFEAVPQTGRVTCRGCGSGDRLFISGESAEILRRMERGAFEGLALGTKERKEIGRFLHYLFLHHIEGYRLPSALNILKEVNRI
jgi:DNA repair protein RecO (recombination protein O)